MFPNIDMDRVFPQADPDVRTHLLKCELGELKWPHRAAPNIGGLTCHVPALVGTTHRLIQPRVAVTGIEGDGLANPIAQPLELGH